MARTMPRKKEDSDDAKYVRVVRQDVDKRLTDIKSEIDDIQRKATKTVKEQPLLALGVAFVVGMAVGIVLANGD